ncbi:MAG: ATP-dependent DNA helicase, partial [Clostridia bacterium]|nr:ATP-dependent DNA helicase [Clostridia bacterium]
MKVEGGLVTLSVRELCERAAIGSSIDNRATDGKASVERMTEGTAAHRKLQSGRGADYASEVRLSCVTEYRGLKFSISGIADGVTDKNGDVTVEEIKSVVGHFPKKPIPEHLSQLRCYGYFLLREKELDEIALDLVYYDLKTEKTFVFKYRETEATLFAEYAKLLDAVYRDAEYAKRHANEEIPSVKEKLVFPFPTLRDGQEELIKTTYNAIKNGKRLFAEAPTGIGKTVSVMFPAIKALGDRLCDKIFYVTAKATTRREAFSAAARLFGECGSFRVCTITAKEQVCLCREAKEYGRVSGFCNPDDCKYADGYYDRVGDAIFELLNECHGYSRRAILETAKKYRVCPYELSLDLSEYCDVVICDYNYVFDPVVKFRRYFADDAEPMQSVLLVDEAHNLPDRVRDMYSVELYRSEFENLYAAVGATEQELDKPLEKVIKFLRNLKKLCRDDLQKTDAGEQGFYMDRSPIPKLAETLKEFVKSVELWRKSHRGHPLYNPLSDLVMKARKYLTVTDYYDEKFLSYVEIYGGDTRVKAFCVDPSTVIDKCLEKIRASVFFSATFTPLDYFTDLCGGGKGAQTLRLPSPFDKSNFCVAAVDTLSTRNDDRDDATCKKIATFIAATVSAKAGNYICYFPSYAFMEKVFGIFEKKYKDVETIKQSRNMSQTDRENFINFFSDDEDVLRIGFCVLGGSFSEV